MKKKNDIIGKLKMIAVFIMLVVGMVYIGIIFGEPKENGEQSGQVVSQGEKCYNRYCYEFDWTCCCVEGTDPFSYPQLERYTPSIIPTQATCPEGGDVKWCNVRVDAEPYYGWDWSCGAGGCNKQIYPMWFVGSGNCQVFKEGMWGVWERERWKCENEKMYQGSSNIQLLPGQKIYTWDDYDGRGEPDCSVSATGFIYKYVLLNTGRAGSCVGEIVENTIGCTYPDDYLFGYDEQGRVIAGAQKLDENRCITITTDGNKRVCGSTCDECGTDQDCASRYPNQYNWGGRVLGGYCSNRHLILIGCDVPFASSQQVCIEWEDTNNNQQLDPGETCHEWNKKKECTIVKDISTGIDCCTSDDCSLANQYCEWYEDFKSRCTTKKECSRDLDCGTTIECDSYRGELTKPYCNSEGMCDKKKLQDIECCSANDCPLIQGQTQSCIQNECVETSGKTKCPFGCCTDTERETLYIGGECSEEFECCPDDHICKTDCGKVECDEDGICEAGETSECIDCYEDGNGSPDGDWMKCDFDCPADFNYLPCMVDKHFICPLKAFLVNAFMWVGIIVVILIIIVVIIKLVFRKPIPYMPQVPYYPFGRR